MTSRRCKRRRSNKSYSTLRLSIIIKKSRRLDITAIPPHFNHNKKYHKRHPVRIQQLYRVRKDRTINWATKVGKTLRSRKHHIPKYKIDRNDLWDFFFPKVKSANSVWGKARVHWIRKMRSSIKLHPNHLDNMFLPHWWQI